MDSQKYLGIYLSKDRATVVCLSGQGRERTVVSCFTVSAEGQEGGGEMTELARLVVEGCTQRELEYSGAAVALDCSMFMQHDVHSEFKDPKQIAQTVRFDTEESLATDISDVAVAFTMVSSDETGSQLSVYTARKETLSKLILALQGNNIDPVAVEPDVGCLSRFVAENVAGADDEYVLFAVLSGSSGYLLVPGEAGRMSLARTFLVGVNQNPVRLLAREIPLTSAQIQGGESIKRVRIFDSAGADYQDLGERLGLEVESVDLSETVAAEPDVLSNCEDRVGLTIALGAAFGLSRRERGINFRDDYMPYQGKKMRTQQALRFLSVSVAVLLLALGSYSTSQLLRVSNYRSMLRAKFQPQYAALMLVKGLPGKFRDAERKLGDLLRRIKAANRITGGDEESASGKLMLVLHAFNNNGCAEQTKLEIDSINVTEKSLRIKGSTAGRGGTTRLRKELGAVGLKVETDNVASKGGRDNFAITIALDRGER